MEFLSQMWSFLGLLTVLQNVLPSQLLHLLHSLWQSLQDALTPYSYFDVPEFIGPCAVEPNDLYRHVHLYLHSSLLDGNHHASQPTTRLSLSRPRNSPHLALSVAPNHAVEDLFDGHRLLWAHHVDTVQDSLEERRSFSLRSPKRFARSGLLLPYLFHVSDKAADFEHLSRERRLHTNISSAASGGGGCWASVPFRHPATFDTLALDPALKSRLLADLSTFAAGRDFYRHVGRAWKRGYLLHGPPGCGKSSLVAAMANHLRYDVFDLELTKVADNAELRSLLIQTTNRSIIVIEDIDCSLNLTADRGGKLACKRSSRRRHHREESLDGVDDDTDTDGQRVTLSGLLNFTDGLWSCCGEERIIVFTTNHKDGVDKALLRSGRMDVHVRLGACGPHAFRELVRGYLGVEEHGLLGVAESCIRAGGALTPAEVGEVLLRNRGDADAAISEAVAEMQTRVLVSNKGGSDSGGGESEFEDRAAGESPAGSWDVTAALPPGGFKAGGKRKAGALVGAATWERKVKFLTRLRSLTRSDSGRRGA